MHGGTDSDSWNRLRPNGRHLGPELRTCLGSCVGLGLAQRPSCGGIPSAPAQARGPSLQSKGRNAGSAAGGGAGRGAPRLGRGARGALPLSRGEASFVLWSPERGGGRLNALAWSGSLSGSGTKCSSTSRPSRDPFAIRQAQRGLQGPTSRRTESGGSRTTCCPWAVSPLDGVPRSSAAAPGGEGLPFLCVSGPSHPEGPTAGRRAQAGRLRRPGS